MARPKPKGMTRRQFLRRVGVGAATVAAGGGIAALVVRNAARKRAAVADRTASFKGKALRPRGLAQSAVTYGLTNREALMVDGITKKLQKIDPTITYKRIIETIGKNKYAGPEAVENRIGVVRGKASDAELARLERVKKVLELLEGLKKTDRKVAVALEQKLVAEFEK